MSAKGAITMVLATEYVSAFDKDAATPASERTGRIGRNVSDWIRGVADGICESDAELAKLRAELDLCCELKREYQAREASAVDDANKLRTDLAAAVAERDRLTRSIEDDFSGWRAVERRWKLRAEQAESRLAAIEAAPTVAWQWMDTGHFRKNKPDGALVFDWRPLIARPAKD